MSSFYWLPALNKQYGLDIHPFQIKPFGDGHIHQTFLIESEEKRLILQKFNNLVFKYPERISHNQSLLIDQIDPDDLPFTLPLPIPNLAGELFTIIDGTFFRVSPFVAGKCVNEVQNPQQAYLAAKAFAQFIKAGIHIPATEFQEAIPGFHDLELRYNQLLVALKNTKRILSGELKELVEFYLGQKDLVDQYLSWKEKLPLRLTHSDTKINNLIFAEDFSKVNAVIDLDTLMAGYVNYDFGDLVRTVACTEGEGSTDWEKIKVDAAKYEALLEGFLDVGNGVFTEDEIKSLPYGGLMMTCIMGFRFLADYLNGNIYYTIHYEEQNLHRAKNQMCLLRELRELKS